MLDPIGLPVFAHAQWRTGSTYLASRFALSPRYMLFYEPCHEYVGDRRRITRAREMQANKLAALRHPDVGGGYFDAYEQVDPLTGQSLTNLYEPSAALRDVYNDVSARTIAFLEACVRVATAQERIAVFGFCRSGTVQRSMSRAMAGTRFYLWRDPRGQFRSYDWPNNDYFVPGTLVQLLRSRLWRAPALEIADGRFPRAALTVLDGLPDRLTDQHYRVGRLLARRLTGKQSYALFYLAWLISREAARGSSEMMISLSDLARDDAARTTFEGRFEISLDDVRPMPVEPDADAEDRFAAVEERVQRRVGIIG